MIDAILDAYAQTRMRKFDDRENTVGSSDAGQCARKNFFVKNAGDHLYGAAADEDFADGWGARLRGTLFEDHFWLPAMRRRFGKKLLFAGKRQRTFVLGYLSATPDGMVIKQSRDALAEFGIEHLGPSGAFVVEAKTIDPRIKLEKAKEEHVFQAVVQMGLIRALTSYQPDYALISYTNASFVDDTEEFVIPFDSDIFEVAQQRAARILTARSASELKPEGWIGGGKECEYCRYTRACGIERHAVPTRPPQESPDSQFIAEVSDLGREVRERRDDIKVASTELREIEHALRERLREKSVYRILGHDVIVTWTSVKGRPSFDMPKIREAAAKAGIDLNQFETVGESTSRLDVRVIGAAERADR